MAIPALSPYTLQVRSAAAGFFLALAVTGVLTDIFAPERLRLVPTALAATEPKLDPASPRRAPAASAPQIIRRDRDGLFRVKAVINGTELSLILDTGATTTVVTGADAARIGLAAADTGLPSTITTAAGPSPMRWGRARDVRLAGATLTNIDIAIMDQGLGTSLLGQNMLDQLGPFTIDGNQLRFNAVS